MKESKRPIWRKSMVQTLNLESIYEYLDEIAESGDAYGYETNSEYHTDRNGYYKEYKELFDDLSDGAYLLGETLRDSETREYWDDMTVALLGTTHKVLGYDVPSLDYAKMLSFCEDLAIEEATKRIERLSKKDMIRCFRRVLTTLILFFDIKASHDCLVSIVTELDERAAMMKNGTAPQRAWVE